MMKTAMRHSVNLILNENLGSETLIYIPMSKYNNLSQIKRPGYTKLKWRQNEDRKAILLY